MKMTEKELKAVKLEALRTACAKLADAQTTIERTKAAIETAKDRIYIAEQRATEATKRIESLTWELIVDAGPDKGVQALAELLARAENAPVGKRVPKPAVNDGRQPLRHPPGVPYLLGNRYFLNGEYNYTLELPGASLHMTFAKEPTRAEVDAIAHSALAHRSGK